jgi:diguanylate cyclase (GGDEF)-like protein
MGRVAGSLFLVSSVVTVAAIVFPHSPKADVGGISALAVATAVLTALLLGWSERLPAWCYQALMVFASMLIAFSLYFNGERHGGPAALNEVFYLWVALYAGYFFTRRQIVAQLGVVATTYAAALVAIDPGPIAFTRWFLTLGMVSAAATLVHVLKHHNDDLVERLAHAARSDSLTGAFNRRGFDERFELEFERALRTEQPLALVMGDLDHLKAINDRWGHPAGDAALVEVGRILDRALRKIDSVARIGGDEFALLLPATDAQAAFEVAQRVRRNVSNVLNRDGSTLTMSFGIVEFPLHGATRETLVHAADEALYRAKELGSDRTIVHPESGKN